MAKYDITDPLAQTFFVEKPCVVTKADLYFQAKDASIPLVVQLRQNDNGTPGSYVIPFSSVSVPSANVKTSDNANVATTVTFGSPVYLDPGEYSITLGSASKNYKAWVSELNEIDIVSNKKISEQPYIGSLFKSQNSTAWTPVQSQDLKFVLYKAQFSTSATSTIDFRVKDDTSELNTTALENDPIEFFPGMQIARVYHNNHGMQDGAYVRFSGFAGYYADNANSVIGVSNIYGVLANTIDQTNLTISNTTTNSYTIQLDVTPNNTSVVRVGGPSIKAETDLKVDMIYPYAAMVKQAGVVIPSYKATGTDYTLQSSFTDMVFDDNELDSSILITSNVNSYFSLSTPGADSFTYRLELSTDDEDVAPLVDKNQLGLVLATNIIDSPTYNSRVLEGIDEITVCDTQIKANITFLSGNIGLLSLADSNDQANARGLTKGTMITIDGSYEENNGNARIISVLEDGANVKIFNISNTFIQDWSSNTLTIVNGPNFIFEEAASGGSTTSKYITREINFLNPSTTINLRVDMCKPTSSDLEIYYRTKTVGDIELLSSKEFIRMTNVTIPTSLSGEFYEVEKQIDDLEPFTALSIKIVFKGTNSAQSPKIKNLRVIALE